MPVKYFLDSFGFFTCSYISGSPGRGGMAEFHWKLMLFFAGKPLPAV